MRLTTVLSVLLGLCPLQVAHADRPKTIVVSDLHLGIGHAADQSKDGTQQIRTACEDDESKKAKPSGSEKSKDPPDTASWNPFEDFRWADEWQGFLNRIDRENNHGTTLVLNGDTFELWQSSTCDCRYTSKDAGCTEDEAVARLERVLAAHAAELNSLKDFAGRGNTVLFIPGNHDAALTLPKVKAALLAVTGTNRFDVASDSGYWLGLGGKVYIEHGHEIGHDANRFEEWPKPVIEDGKCTYLRRSWGERFVQEFYNDHERKFPIVDNIAREATGVKFAYVALGPVEAAAHIGEFFRFFLFGVSWPQFKGGMGADKKKEGAWDYERTRELGDAFLVDLLPADDPMRSVARASIDTTGVGLHMKDLTDEELRFLCDRRGEENKALREMHRSELRNCVPAGGLGAMGDMFRAPDSLLEDRFNEILRKGGPAGYLAYVYGHTHVAENPRPIEMPQWTVTVVNTGAWQRTIGAEQLDEVMRKCGISQERVLEMQPEDLPGCYNFVSIAPDHESSPELHNWHETRGGNWDVGDGPCTELPYDRDCPKNSNNHSAG